MTTTQEDTTTAEALRRRIRASRDEMGKENE
jgi:hypothetical protein